MESFLGYSLAELRTHIERQFSKGMDWPAFMAREVHLDHIRPVSSFDLSKPDEVRACYALTNLRPVWAAENLSKGATLTHLI